MLKILSIFLFVFIIFPIIVVLILMVIGFSFLTRVKMKRKAPDIKPKGTIEILPAEKSDTDLETTLDTLQKNVKDRKIGKDKFRDL